MSTDLLTELRTYLVGQGLCRLPGTNDPTKPPLWLAPVQGVPAPGETPPGGNATNVGADVVLGAFWTGGFTPRPYEASAWRTPTVDLQLRCRLDSFSRTTEKAISAVIVDKREWTMGGIQIIESQYWRALQPTVLDLQGCDYVVSYAFQVYA